MLKYRFSWFREAIWGISSGLSSKSKTAMFSWMCLGLEETGHGLILALKDAPKQTWDTINGWTSTTDFAGTTLKVLRDDAARGANLTSYTVLGETAVSNWAPMHFIR